MMHLGNAALAAYAMANAFDTRADCILAGACLAAFARSAYATFDNETRYFYGETTAALLRRTRRVLFSERDPSRALAAAATGLPRGSLVVEMQRLDAPRYLTLALPATADEFFSGDAGADVLRVLGRNDAVFVTIDGAARCLSGGACVSCSDRPPDGMRFRTCGRCRVARYCSTECQRRDYGEHRAVCAALLAAIRT